MNKIKKLWNYLSGKKRGIALLILMINSGIKAFFPELLTPDQLQFLDLLGGTLGGIGLAHAGKKQYDKKHKNSKV